MRKSLTAAALPARPLLGLSLDELRALAAECGQPAFRGNQLHTSLYGRGRVRSLDAATQLPETFRSTLAAKGVVWGRSTVHSRAQSVDGTLKLLLRLHDGAIVETVGIPAKRAVGTRSRLTVCLSSQVGCAMGCSFCATARQGGGRRNLLPHEIVDQALHIGEQMEVQDVGATSGVVVDGNAERGATKKDKGKGRGGKGKGKGKGGGSNFLRVDNAVFMGQGEAFMNLKNVLVARGDFFDFDFSPKL